MNKKNIFLIGFMSLLIVFGLVFANAKNGSDDVFGEDESSDISEATASINSTEVAMSDDDLSSEKVSFDKRTISSGNGWIITDGKGALIDVQFLSGYSGHDIISKGWIKAGNLKLKIESSDGSSDKKTFSVSGGNSVNGNLVLEKDQSYQDGFATWNGKLTLQTSNGSYDSSLRMALTERTLGEDNSKKSRLENSNRSKNDDSNESSEDNSGKGSSESSNNGFWKRFLRIFGGN